MSFRQAILVSFKDARDIRRITCGADRAGFGEQKGACHVQSPSRSAIVRVYPASCMEPFYDRVWNRKRMRAVRNHGRRRRVRPGRHGKFCPKRGSKPLSGGIRSNSRHSPPETASGFVGREKGRTGRTERSSLCEGGVHSSINTIAG